MRNYSQPSFLEPEKTDCPTESLLLVRLPFPLPPTRPVAFFLIFFFLQQTFEVSGSRTSAPIYKHLYGRQGRTALVDASAKKKGRSAA